MISAADVAEPGINAAIGARNNDKRKHTPVVTAVRPVRPPAATPAELSTKAVVVEVPSIAPPVTATASTNIALPTRFLPSSGSFIIPARVAVPTNVPNVSNNSTKVNVTIADMRPVCIIPSQSKAIKFN
ncbi:hypothetical protein D3C76_949920 [compost metagenome]